MARRWLYALITYTGGHALVEHGVKFKFNKPKPVKDREVVKFFENRPNFTVADYYEDIIQKMADVEDEPRQELETEPEVVEEKVEVEKVIEKKEEPKKVLKKSAPKKKILKKKKASRKPE
ncbi:MAG: hypothetical protein KAS32_19680 [Candidatus Peribacteraceae bacterium]|nr:hypothetical protein [Candidatus Peribacteraceae bacterium]